MINAYILNLSKPKSLTAQIRDAERQVLKRQQGVGVRADALARKIRQQMTAPATLLLAGGVGFIIGEITKRQALKYRGAANKPSTAGITPLRSTLNLVASLHTLYKALPLVWLMKFLRQPGASHHAPERRFRPAAASRPIYRR